METLAHIHQKMEEKKSLVVAAWGEKKALTLVLAASQATAKRWLPWQHRHLRREGSREALLMGCCLRVWAELSSAAGEGSMGFSDL